jgi:hypothetical protein
MRAIAAASPVNDMLDAQAEKLTKSAAKGGAD